MRALPAVIRTLAVVSLGLAIAPGCEALVDDGTPVLAVADATPGGDGELDALDELEGSARPPRDGSRREDGTLPSEAATEGGEAEGSSGPPVCSPACSVGQGCQGADDCLTQVCAGGVCAGCSPLCEEGAECAGPPDCASQQCMAGKCAPPACTPVCGQGAPCGGDAECMSHHCQNARCV